jgi:hypothetical protein
MREKKPLAAITCLTGACPPLPLSAHSADIPEAPGTESSPIELDLDCPTAVALSESISISRMMSMNPTHLREVNGPTTKVSELEGDDLEENLKEHRAETVIDKLLGPKTSAGWKKGEQNRSLGYNGLKSNAVAEGKDGSRSGRTTKGDENIICISFNWPTAMI